MNLRRSQVRRQGTHRPADRDVEGEPLRLGQLQDLRVPAGRRLRFSLDDLTENRPVTALVSASSPIVAERFSYSSDDGDTAALLGIPLTRTP